jgi:hypothetical protein
MNWGKGIVIAFVLFTLLIVSMVVISMKQDVNLVSVNYYQNELEYQYLLDHKNNAAMLEEKPGILIRDKLLVISFPYPTVIDRGEVTLFRSSDANLDQKFTFIQSADSIRAFNIQNLRSGAYRVQINWSMEGKDFYFEKNVYVKLGSDYNGS